VNRTVSGKRIDGFIPWDACVTWHVSNPRGMQTIGNEHRRQSEVEADQGMVSATGMNTVEGIDRDQGIGVNKRGNADIVS